MANAELDAIRVLLASAPRPATLAERRARLDEVFGQFPVDPDIAVEPVIANGVEGEWTTAPEADRSRVLLYLHGGGYVSGSLASHRHMVAKVGRAGRVRTLSLAYRLAPEHKFPAALDDAVAGYRFLIGLGIQPAHIVIGGDSAGGGLTVATMLTLRNEGDPQPAAGWCISPWVDLEQTGPSMATKAAIDPIISKPYLVELAASYLQGAEPRNPMASPLHADLRGLAPLLIQVGSAETLLDDATGLATRAAAADVRTTLSVWPEMIHVWHLFHARLGMAREAIAEAGGFLGAAVRERQ